MVLISHDKEFVFLKTMKSASSSLEETLEYYLLDAPIDELGETTIQRVTATGYVSGRGLKEAGSQFMHPHISATQVRKLLGAERFDSYLKATTVRNPWDQTVSDFWWRLRNQSRWLEFASTAPMSLVKIAFTLWYYANRSRMKGISFKRRLAIEGSIPDMHVIRYESLQQDLLDLLARLEIQVDQPYLPSRKAHIRLRSEPYQRYYFGFVKRDLARLRASDIKYFGNQWQQG